MFGSVEVVVCLCVYVLVKGLSGCGVSVCLCVGEGSER